MIDLNKFTQPVYTTVPIIENTFVYNRKKYNVYVPVNGWYDVVLRGNDVDIIKIAIPEMHSFKNIISGYVYNNKLIFHNFDEAKRRFGYEIYTDLYFNTLTTFNPVQAVVWEDNKCYFYKPNYTQVFIYELRNYITEDGNIDITGLSGVTPEQKTLLLFHAIELQNQKKLQEQLAYQEKIEELKQSIEGRLFIAFNQVGAKIEKYQLRNNMIEVEWKIKGATKIFNSLIDENFKVIEAGYCMSGDDKQHSVSSLVLTAQDYEEDNAIFQTRSRN